MQTRVLVTGANGQLALTIKALFAVNSENIVFTFVSKSELDISNETEVNQYFNQNHFDFCVNCAAYTNVEQAELTPEPAFKVNALGAKYIARACNENDTVLVHISTDYVFDGTKNTPYTEEDPANPINEYGKSKLLGEQHIQDICPKNYILRTSWLYSNYGKNFLKTIVSKIQNNENLTIINSQTGTPTSTIQLARIIFALLKATEVPFGIYNASALGQTTWYGFAKAISEHFPNYKGEILPVESFKTYATRPGYSVLNNSKAETIYNLETWDICLKETLNTLN